MKTLKKTQTKYQKMLKMQCRLGPIMDYELWKDRNNLTIRKRVSRKREKRHRKTDTSLCSESNCCR